MQVQILGNNSGGLFIKRYFSAQVLRHEQFLFLIDCGEATQMQCAKYHVKIERVDQIFISHLHGDHILGLMGLISSFGMQQRKRPLQIFAPDGLKRFLDVQIEVCQIKLPYPLEVHIVDCSESKIIWENELISVRSIPLRHRVPASGYLFSTKRKVGRNISGAAIQTFSLTISQILDAKKGNPIFNLQGMQIPESELYVDPKPLVRYAYCSDTAYSEEVIALVKGVDILYHEATFLEDNRERATSTGHSTATDAAMVAQKAQVGKLLLGHLSGRFADFETHLEEAQPIFPETYGTIEGETYFIGLRPLDL